MKRILNICLAVTVSAMVIGCLGDDSQDTARLTVKLVDAPGDYDSVFIDVQDVVFKHASDTSDFGMNNVSPGIYDLLELTGGAHVVLADNLIPEGRLNQIRLVLGDENSVWIDSMEYPLATPSAQQSGLKLNIHEDLEGGFTYDLILDFDVDKSIVETGAGEYSLKPTIRASMEANSGAITGSIDPSDYEALVTAVNSAQDSISAHTDSEGMFFLHGVPADSWTVTIEPDPASGYNTETISNVDVTVGEVTDLGVVELE